MRIATYIVAGIVGLVAMVQLEDACEGGKREEPFVGDPQFSVSQPSRLYFANVRSSSYYLERPKGTELELYRLRRFSQTRKRPTLTPVIVQAYLKDEGYVFLRPNAFPGIASPLSVDFSGVDSAGTYTLTVPTRPLQLAFAEDLRRSIRRGDSLALHLDGGAHVPIYETRAERGLFLTVMRDYDALTDK